MILTSTKVSVHVINIQPVLVYIILKPTKVSVHDININQC